MTLLYRLIAAFLLLSGTAAQSQQISNWSKTASENNAAPPNGFPEGQAPSSVNDSARQMMAAIRTAYENAQWLDLGLTPTRIDNDTFTLAGDQTAIYEVGRRVKAIGATTGYGTITASAHDAGTTTVDILMDSGNVPTSLASVPVSIISLANNGLPGRIATNFGTEALPSFTFRTDTNTGIYHSDTDQISITAGGSERIRGDLAFGARLLGGVAFSTVLTPAQITANQNDYAPSGIGTASALRLSSNASRDITGIQTGAVTGRLLLTCNIGPNDIRLLSQNTGSTAAYRFDFNANITLNDDECVWLWYDQTDSRWRAVVF